MAKGFKTGGRKKGTRNRRTQAREAVLTDAHQQIERALGPAAFEGDAHSLLMAIYKDESQPWVLRLDAAKGAIGYEKPKLSAVDANLSGAVGQYAAQIPVERRDSDALESPAGAAVNGHPAGHG